MKTLYVDPPSGWMYGFPKALANLENHETLRSIDLSEFTFIYVDLLKLSKYPEKDIQSALDHSRYWVS